MAAKKSAKKGARKGARKAARKATTKAGAGKTRAKKAAGKTVKKASVRKAPARKATRKAAPAKAARKALAARVTGKPGTSGKAEGDAPVAAFIAGLPPWQRAIAERLDGIVAREVPGVKRAIKWSMPVYGQAGKGWFAYLAPFTKHVGFGFYEGASLAPTPPEGGGKGLRHVKLASPADVDEGQVSDWVRQAAALPGWGRA